MRTLVLLAVLLAFGAGCAFLERPVIGGGADASDPAATAVASPAPAPVYGDAPAEALTKRLPIPEPVKAILLLLLGGICGRATKKAEEKK